MKTQFGGVMKYVWVQDYGIGRGIYCYEYGN